MNSNQDAGVGHGGRRTGSLCCVGGGKASRGWSKESIMILNRMCSFIITNGWTGTNKRSIFIETCNIGYSYSKYSAGWLSKRADYQYYITVYFTKYEWEIDEQYSTPTISISIGLKTMKPNRVIMSSTPPPHIVRDDVALWRQSVNT